MKQRHFLNKIEVTEPINYQELSIELNYDKDSNSQAVSVNEWVFGVGDQRKKNDGFNIIKKYLSDGINGGVGVLEGIPYGVLLDNEKGTTYPLLDAYVDASKGQFDHDRVTVPTVVRGNIDWLNETADKFTFAYLESIGLIGDSDYVPVPYCINKKQNAVEIIVTALSIFIITDKIIEAIKDIVGTLGASQPFTASYLIVYMITEIIYLIILFISLIALILALYKMLVQPVKYHYGMYATNHIEKGLSYLGLKLSSSILQRYPYNQLLIIPEKYATVENKGGFLGISGAIKPKVDDGKGYYKGTFGELLRQLKEMFHAKIIIDNGTLYFEKKDFKLSAPLYILPDVFDSRYKFTMNPDELNATYIVRFQTDLNDRNTIQNYFGTSVQVTQTPKVVNDKTMSLFKNLKEIVIPFAKGTRKTTLTGPEKSIDLFLKGVGIIIDGIIIIVNIIIIGINIVIKVLNAIIKFLASFGIKLGIKIKEIEPIEPAGFKNLIGDRIDMLVMEGDYISVPKMVILKQNSNAKNNKLDDGNANFLNARYLYENFHYFQSFCESNGWQGNQYLFKELEKIPFTFSNFESVRTNSQIKNGQGQDGDLITLKFNPYEETATGTYKIQKRWTNNIQESIYEPDGS